MFGFGFSELLVVTLVALLVIGPEDVPRVMYQLGKIVRRISYMKYAFTQQFDDFMMNVENQKKRVVTQTDGAGEEVAPSTAKPQDVDTAHFDVARLPNENADKKFENHE